MNKFGKISGKLLAIAKTKKSSDLRRILNDYDDANSGEELVADDGNLDATGKFNFFTTSTFLNI